MRVIELFAGIGACSKALKNIGQDVEIVDAVEIDKYAMASFNAIHNTNFEVQDIKTWDKYYENIDLITHGSPCQDFSIAGKQAGGDIGSGTRSSLMYETIRIVGKIRPKYVLWENVKNILSDKHKHNFDAYIETMNNLGYTSYYQVLNAKNYGIPQNRERVYTISIRKDIDKGNFLFPKKEELKLRLKDILENEVNKAYYLDNGKIKNKKLKETINKNIDIIQENSFIDSYNKRVNNSGITNTITTRVSASNLTHIIRNSKIRKLTPKECWRLMGFDDEDFEKAAKVNSNTQLYKQARKFNLRTSFRKDFLSIIFKIKEKNMSKRMLPNDEKLIPILLKQNIVYFDRENKEYKTSRKFYCSKCS